MTTAPTVATQPARRTRTTRVTRTQVAARRGALVLAAAVTLVVPAQLTLSERPTGSALVAGATGLGVVALLNFVLVGSIWNVTRAYTPVAGGLAAVALAAAAGLQLYAALALLMTGASGVDGFEGLWASSLAAFGVHLLALSATLPLRRAAGLVALGVGAAGVAVLAAVIPPFWFPKIPDALFALVAGQTLLTGWLLAVGFRSPKQR